MGLDGLQQIACPSVVKEKDSLSHTPERSGSELVGTGTSLRDAIRKPLAHVVYEKIGKEVRLLVGKCGTRAC